MSGRLADNVAHFARILRRAGMPVGPASVLDALAAVEATGLRVREDFYWTLHAVFVNRHEHTILFDAAFDRYWRARGLLARMLPPIAPPAPASPERTPPKAGALRVAEAMNPRQPVTAPDERRLTAEMTTSDAEVLRAKDFSQMSAAEMAAAKRLIAGLRLPFDVRPTRRFAAARRGIVDPRASFRRSLRAGGAGIALAFRKREAKPPPLVALVDISGSMEAYSRLFLHFLHALAESGRRVHVFVFATRLTNITRALRRRDPDEALAQAAAQVQDWEGGTRIAGCLHGFNRLWSRRVLGQGATLILVTDGLEREAGADLAFEMDRLKRSCRRLIWLNPLLRYEAFSARAAGIRAMLPHVHEFRSIHNLAAMDDLVAALAADGGPHRRPQSWLRAAE